MNDSDAQFVVRKVAELWSRFSLGGEECKLLLRKLGEVQGVGVDQAVPRLEAMRAGEIAQPARTDLVQWVLREMRDLSREARRDQLTQRQDSIGLSAVPNTQAPIRHMIACRSKLGGDTDPCTCAWEYHLGHATERWKNGKRGEAAIHIEALVMDMAVFGIDEESVRMSLAKDGADVDWLFAEIERAKASRKQPKTKYVPPEVKREKANPDRARRNIDKILKWSRDA